MTLSSLNVLLIPLLFAIPELYVAVIFMDSTSKSVGTNLLYSGVPCTIDRNRQVSLKLVLIFSLRISATMQHNIICNYYQ